MIRTIRQDEKGVRLEEQTLLEGELPEGVDAAAATRLLREAREFELVEVELASAGGRGKRKP